MKKKGWTAVFWRSEKCARTKGPGWRITGKRGSVWLCSICLGLAVMGCGAGGRQSGAEEEMSARKVQETEGVQKVQDAQETESTQGLGNEQNQQEAAGTQNAEALREQVLAEMTDAQKNWMGGLSRERRLADFESLCDGLRENYPYVKLAKRQAGADLDALEAAYREKVEQCANDDSYWYVVKDFVREFSGTGHLELWGRRYESELASKREYVKESGEEERWAPYLETLDNPVSHRTYASMMEFYEEVERLTEVKLAEESGGGRGETAETGEEQQAVETAATAADGKTASANVETKILEEGKTAYVSIDYFGSGDMAADRDILLPFYEEIDDYENLIIDITHNPGGSMRYFNELVVAPLAGKTLTVPGYQLFKDGENNRTFLRVAEGAASGLYQPIDRLPAMPKLNREDAADCDWFLREDYTVEPTGEGFGGKIWLLVSENNYSSSEYAAMFSKVSGFATLVGRTTSGDGIGTDPCYLILPESGLVVQYSPMYGVTADGTGSEEYGTVPDIVSPEGESALETCLGRIK